MLLNINRWLVLKGYFYKIKYNIKQILVIFNKGKNIDGSTILLWRAPVVTGYRSKNSDQNLGWRNTKKRAIVCEILFDS